MDTESQKPTELYNISRGQIEHNHISIGLRLIWLNNCLAFMFGIYAAVTLFRGPTIAMFGKAQTLSVLIPYIGIGVSLFTLLDIISSIVRMYKVRVDYENADMIEPAIIPQIDGIWYDRFLQRLSPVAQSLLFLFVWTYLALYDQQLL